MVEATDHVEQRALAAARRADEGDKGLRVDDEIDTFDRGHIDFAGAIGFNELFGAY